MRNQRIAILENAQEQMLGLDGQAAQDGRLVPGEKQRAPGRLVSAFRTLLWWLLLAALGALSYVLLARDVG